MKIPNYLPGLAEKYPNIYLVLNKKILGIIRSAYIDIKKTITAKSFRKLAKVSKANTTAIMRGKQSPSLNFISIMSKYVEWNFWGLIYENVDYLRSKTNINKIKIPKELIPELAYLLGALRDGSMTHYSNIFEIEISQNFKEWLKNSVVPKFNKVFEVNPKIKLLKRKPNNTFAIRLRSAPLYGILKILSGYERYNFLTPNIILNAPFELNKYYIAGYYDAEGSKNRSSISFYQNWKDTSGCPSLIDIKNFLISRGINTSLTYHKQKHYEAYIYTLYVKSESKSRFLEEIPLEHPKILK